MCGIARHSIIRQEPAGRQVGGNPTKRTQNAGSAGGQAGNNKRGRRSRENQTAGRWCVKRAGTKKNGMVAVERRTSAGRNHRELCSERRPAEVLQVRSRWFRRERVCGARWCGGGEMRGVRTQNAVRHVRQVVAGARWRANNNGR